MSNAFICNPLRVEGMEEVDWALRSRCETAIDAQVIRDPSIH
jgi:hypothetical protein